MCRRIARRWADEYDGLRPVADLIRLFQASISLWLDKPTGWTRQPASEDERRSAINEIRKKVSVRVHKLAEQRLITDPLTDWQTAFAFSGRGSSRDRAEEIRQIYEAAAPSITSAMDDVTQRFLEEFIQIVRYAIEAKGGSLG